MNKKLIKIKKIETINNKKQVYDISVADNHNFFANNILVHNCHNYGTKNLLPYVGRDVKYKLGLTATLERMDDTHWEIMEMFDYNLFKYTPKEALFDGVLNPFNFVNIGVHMDDESFEQYLTLTQEINVLLQMGGGYKRMMRGSSGLKNKMLSKMNDRKDLVNNYYRKFDVVKEVCDRHRNDKIIIFNQFNKQTSKLYWYLLDIGIKARVIHSGMPQDKRDQDLMDFKNDKYNVLLTSKVLDEGYNLPKIDTAIIMAGDSTAKQTIQRLGRVLRKKEKTSSLYQIFCCNTIEQEQGENRSKLFKELASTFHEVFFDGKNKVLTEVKF